MSRKFMVGQNANSLAASFPGPSLRGAQQSLVSAEHAILVIIGYGLAFLIIAGVLVRRRDVA